MKCISKRLTLILLVSTLILLSGCGSTSQTTSYKNSYNIYQTSFQYGLLSKISTNVSTSKASYFGNNLCVSDGSDLGTDKTQSTVAVASGVFNTVTKEVTYSQNLNKRMFPASTTKILTAYIALKYGDLNSVVTVSENAVKQASDSSVCGLKAGDKLTLHQLLYGLLMRSGNDAAVAIAESISGDVDSFAKLMNQEAAALGATNSHFVNPNGLQSDDHYTTVYDMYLFMNAAVSNDKFLEIITTPTYTCDYTDASGAAVQQIWNTTNKYLLGTETSPDGVTVIGGKTGTTFDAGYCLVIYAKNAKDEPLISVIMKADCRNNLYYYMNQLLGGFTN